MLNTIPPDQIKHKNYQSQAIITGLALALIYGLVVIGVLWFGTTLSDLVVPLIVLIFFWVFVVGLVAVGTGIQAQRERAGIEALFAEPAWLTWQYTTEEWQKEYEQIYRSEKLLARASCSNLLVGPVFGGVFLLIGFFTRNSPYSSFLIFVGIVVGAGIMLLGIVQFSRGRAEAQQHYAEAQQTPSPLLIFGQDGLYHQIKGYTSLRRMYKAEILSPGSADRVTQMTYAYVNRLHQGSNVAYLRLRNWSRRGTGTITLAIPQRYEAETKQLVDRYDQYLKGRGYRRW